MAEYGVYYNGVFHFFRTREKAEEFADSIPKKEKGRCIRLYW